MNEADLPLTWVIKAIADQAINIEFGEVIDERINQRVTSFTAALRQKKLQGVTACIPTYRSLTVTYDSMKIRQTRLTSVIEELLSSDNLDTPEGKCWQIPVCYGGEHGIDLEDVSASLGLTPDELISIHSAQIYRIYMIGFVPGFAYLGGLDERLHIPRRTSPRLEVPSGSISIGGMQSAIGSVAAPSGWHLLGRTPVKSFDLHRDHPFLFNAGETVCFHSISAEEYRQLSTEPGYMPKWSQCG